MRNPWQLKSHAYARPAEQDIEKAFSKPGRVSAARVATWSRERLWLVVRWAGTGIRWDHRSVATVPCGSALPAELDDT